MSSCVLVSRYWRLLCQTTHMSMSNYNTHVHVMDRSLFIQKAQVLDLELNCQLFTVCAIPFLIQSLVI